MAQLDFEKALPKMIEGLVMMIDRLRVFTGPSLGCDPSAGLEQNEKAITAWEQWSRDSGRLQFTSDTTLLPVPTDGGNGSL